MDPIRLLDLSPLPSPGLIVDADRVRENVQTMVRIAGDPARLRPHLKTHKMREVIELQLSSGITKFKAATIAEAALACAAGADDVLLAHQPVGQKVDALAKLRERHPRTRISTIVDDQRALGALCERVGSIDEPILVWIDVDCGMGRTGVGFGADLNRLRDAIEADGRCHFAGLHVYDGHIHNAAASEREAAVRPVREEVGQYVASRNCPAIAVGGTPTFPVWARETEWECCPGTPLLWDIGYARNYKDLPFRIAAALITRVVSKPGAGRLCLDLGHKAVASERELAERVVLPDLAESQFVSHSEEHLVVSTTSASEHEVGDALVAYPRHICPTVALYDEALVVRGGVPTGERWRITRGR